MLFLHKDTEDGREITYYNDYCYALQDAMLHQWRHLGPPYASPDVDQCQSRWRNFFPVGLIHI